MNDVYKNQKPPKKGGSVQQKTEAELRDERLKAALKANMGRRKAQAKARTGQNTEKTQGQ